LAITWVNPNVDERAFERDLIAVIIKVASKIEPSTEMRVADGGLMGFRVAKVGAGKYGRSLRKVEYDLEAPFRN